MSSTKEIENQIQQIEICLLTEPIMNWSEIFSSVLLSKSEAKLSACKREQRHNW